MNNQYQQVTDRIAAAIAAGTPPWRKPWADIAGAASPGIAGRPLRENGNPYTGINTIVLWEAAMRKGYDSRYWFTYKRAAELGAQVRKGEKSELAFFVGKYVPQAARERDGDDAAERAFLKSYHVFNACQIDGLPEHYLTAKIPAAMVAESGRIATVDAFVDATGATVRHGGNKAFYMPSVDAITMPTMAQFTTPARYYGTLLHELTHWTGAESRLDRLSKFARFGSESYAAEELVAELGAAFLCADLGIPNETEQAAAYMNGWLKVLQHDNRFIFRAASLAERAAAFLKGTAPEPQPPALRDDDKPTVTVIALPAPIAAPVVAPAAPTATAEPEAAPAVIALPAPIAPAMVAPAAPAAIAASVTFKPAHTIKQRRKAKRAMLADGALPTLATGIESYTPQFQRAYAAAMQAGAVKPASGEQFATMLCAAKINATAELGAGWSQIAGASLVTLIPAKWSGIKIYGRTASMSRAQRIPAARYWPGAAIPAGLECETRDATAEPVLFGDTVHDGAARSRYEAFKATVAPAPVDWQGQPIPAELAAEALQIDGATGQWREPAPADLAEAAD